MSEIDELRKELRDSQKQQNEINARLLEMLAGFTAQKPSEEKPVQKKAQEIIIPKKNYTGLKQPRPDSMIRLQSLTKGELCLNVNGSVAINFEKYGDIKPVLYSELVNIVNNNRSFAENGAFYIMDDSAVFYLGLARFYDHVMSWDDIENIESFDDDVLRQMLPKVSDFQKGVLAVALATKIFNDEPVDMNKVDVVSKVCKIDIVGEAREMREISNNMK
nr:MAG TPA: hypothetical protein [Caudoviricetes sp.]